MARSERQWDCRPPGTIPEVVSEIERSDGQALTVPGRPPGPGPASPPQPAADHPARTLIRSSFQTFPLKGFRMHLEIGLFASYWLMQLVLPGMIEGGGGAIVNISSLAGLLPGEEPYSRSGASGPIAYGGNKAALHHLTLSVAAEVQAYGISANVLMPSESILTPGARVAAAGERDFGRPEDFAEATPCVALADPQVTNGQLLWSEDVLQLELSAWGWLRAMP